MKIVGGGLMSIFITASHSSEDFISKFVVTICG